MDHTLVVGATAAFDTIVLLEIVRAQSAQRIPPPFDPVLPDTVLPFRVRCASSPTSSGIATDVYTATGPKGTATVSATLDGQVVSIPINIGYQSFTDDPLIAGVTVVRAVHLTELRTRIDAIRTHYGLPAFPYTTQALAAGTIIQAQHILDLRTALGQAYTAAARSVPTYTDPALPAGTTIKVAHIAEIRAAIIGIE